MRTPCTILTSITFTISLWPTLPLSCCSQTMIMETINGNWKSFLQPVLNKHSTRPDVQWDRNKMSSKNNILTVSLVGIALPLVLCLSVVTVTPPIPETTKISVRQFEQEFYEAFQGYVNTRSVSEDMKKLKKILLDQTIDISLVELPRTDEVRTFIVERPNLDDPTKHTPPIAAPLVPLVPCSVLFLPSVQPNRLVRYKEIARSRFGPLQSLIAGRPLRVRGND